MELVFHFDYILLHHINFNNVPDKALAGYFICLVYKGGINSEAQTHINLYDS